MKRFFREKRIHWFFPGGGKNAIIMCVFMALSLMPLPQTSHASQMVERIIANHISVDGKIVWLFLPSGGIHFVITWIGEDGKQWQKTHLARKGVHAYEMRDHHGWKGEVRAVGISIFSGARGGVISPSWENEWDIFWAPEQWIPSTINFLHGHRLLGFTWNTVLLAVMLFTSVIYYFALRRFFVFSLFIGFVIAFGAMELRAMYDHFAIINTLEDNFSMNLMKDLEKTGEMIKRKVGGGTWTQKGLPWPHSTFMNYALAEHRYIPYTTGSHADIVIEYKNGQILFSDGMNE